MDSGAQLNPGGPLRIFTSKREDTVIGAPLNGQAFIPGPLFVDSNQEQWGSAFPKDFGGIPFMVFYKSGLDPLWTTKATQIFAEMFANLATYDQLFLMQNVFFSVTTKPAMINFSIPGRWYLAWTSSQKGQSTC